MPRQRNPKSPSLSLPEAIDLVGKIHAEERKYPVAREAAVKHLGYSSLNGASASTLSVLSQYGLLERAGKSEARVTDLAVDILHPETEQQKRAALEKAAEMPPLFKELTERYSDGLPSEENLRGQLARVGFANGAIDQVVRAYMDTREFLANSKESESHRHPDKSAQESSPQASAKGEGEMTATAPSANEHQRPASSTPTMTAPHSTPFLDGEREISRGALSKQGAGYRLIVSGEIGVKELDRLIRLLTVQKDFLVDDENGNLN